MLQTITLYQTNGEFAGVRRFGSNNPIEISGVRIWVDGVVGTSGLELKADPGVPLVYAGFGGACPTCCPLGLLALIVLLAWLRNVCSIRSCPLETEHACPLCIAVAVPYTMMSLCMQCVSSGHICFTVCTRAYSSSPDLCFCMQA